MPFDTSTRAVDGAARREFDFFKNTGGVAITAGIPVVFDVSQPVPGDIGISIPNTAAENSLLIGVAMENIATGEYGKIQRYGFIENVAIRQEAGTAIAIGDRMKINGAAAEFIRAGAAAGSKGECIVLETSGVGTALVTLNCYLGCL